MNQTNSSYQPKGIEEDERALLMDYYVQKVEGRLRQLRSPGENDKKRWVWELLQNAKDSISSLENRQVNIVVDAQQDHVLFTHDGAPFTPKALNSLIWQKSGEKRSSAESTGRFGTGFLTTHTLSQNVELSSILLDSEDTLYGVKVHLHREGETDDELRAGINKTLASRQYTVAPANQHTIFKYNLKSQVNRDSAKAGIKSLRDNIYFTLAFVQQINSITLIDEGHSLKVCKKGVENLSNNLQIVRFETTSEKGNVVQTSILYAKVEEDSPELSKKYKQPRKLRYAVAIQLDEANRKILAIPSNAPHLHCMFPLVGTEQFHFPVVINSPDFEPTPERDRLFLDGEDFDEEKEIITNDGINKTIISGAVELYAFMLRYLSENGWQNPHYLALGARKLPNQDKYFDVTWYKETIQQQLRELVLSHPIIETSDGLKMLNDICFPQGGKADGEIDQIWQFTNDIVPGKLPKKELIAAWADLVWEPSQEQTTRKLAEQVAEFGSLNALAKDAVWQDRFLEFVQKFDKDYLEEYALIPNAKGNFQPMNCEDLSISDNLPEVAYKLLLPFGVDWEEVVIHSGITVIETPLKKGLEELSNEINALIKKGETNEIPEFRKAILNLISYIPAKSEAISEAFIEKRKCIWQYARDIFGEAQPEQEEVVGLEEEIWERCDVWIVNELISQVSAQQSLDGLLALSDVLDTNWLDGFVSFAVTHTNSDFLNRDTHKILPNQYGNFVVKEDLSRDNDIPYELKEQVFVELGLDLKKKLLHKGIYQFSPEQTTTITNVASSINDLLENRDIDEELKHQTIFRLASLLPTEGAEKQKKIWGFSRSMYGNVIAAQTITLNNSYPELWRKANKLLIDKMIQDIEAFAPTEEESSIQQLGVHLQSISEKEQEDWIYQANVYISSLIDFLHEIDHTIGCIVPNQNDNFCRLDDLYANQGISEQLKDILALLDKEKDFRHCLVSTWLNLKPSRVKDTRDIAKVIDDLIRDNYKDEVAKNNDAYRDAVKGLVVDLFNQKSYSPHIYEEVGHYTTNRANKALFGWSFSHRYELETNVLSTVEERQELYRINNIIRDKGLSPEDIEVISKEEKEELEQFRQQAKEGGRLDDVMSNVLAKHGVQNAEELDIMLTQLEDNGTLKQLRAVFANENYGDIFGHISNPKYFPYAQKKLARVRERVKEHLIGLDGYNLENAQHTGDTIIAGVKKDGQDITIITRPSDGGFVIIYYDNERDVLDYDASIAELWVEDGNSEPEQLTLGRILKMTGIIKFPMNESEE